MTSNASFDRAFPSFVCKEMDESGKHCLSGAENVDRERRVSTLNARDVNVLQRFTIQTGVAAADHCQEERLHLSKTLRQPRRKGSVVVIQAPIAFPPSRVSLISKLFAEILANERMCIEIATIVRIFAREKSRSP